MPKEAYRYRAISIPWASGSDTSSSVIDASGRTFGEIFFNLDVVEPHEAGNMDIQGWQCVGALRGDFAGWGVIMWLVFTRGDTEDHTR
jgi:hypothetical protein